MTRAFRAKTASVPSGRHASRRTNGVIRCSPNPLCGGIAVSELWIRLTYERFDELPARFQNEIRGLRTIHHSPTFGVGGSLPKKAVAHTLVKVD